MSKQLFISSLFIFVILSIDVSSAEKAQQIKGPIIVTSETLIADNKAHTALFEKNVVARTTEMTIYADKMLAYYKADTGDITKIEATGSVKLIKDTRVITSSEAVYFANEDRIIFTGDPRVVDGKNVVTGTKMTYFLNDDRFFVENSKVFLTEKKEQ
ncbi:MAG: lipopolysaccharide transport periplasmic protein LptA [Nitrospirae bacterium]|nr:lipopolysaccharide transport periplasmic protein LptA [Nitrospirota bacterium]